MFVGLESWPEKYAGNVHLAMCADCGLRADCGFHPGKTPFMRLVLGWSF